MLEDAQVVMSHNHTNQVMGDEVERGGAFAANGTVTLRKSSLVAAWPGQRAQTESVRST